MYDQLKTHTKFSSPRGVVRAWSGAFSPGWLHVHFHSAIFCVRGTKEGVPNNAYFRVHGILNTSEGNSLNRPRPPTLGREWAAEISPRAGQVLF